MKADDASGIAGTEYETGQKNRPAYDLGGRRTQPNRKAIYVKNKKKYMAK